MNQGPYAWLMNFQQFFIQWKKKPNFFTLFNSTGWNSMTEWTSSITVVPQNYVENDTKNALTLRNNSLFSLCVCMGVERVTFNTKNVSPLRHERVIIYQVNSFWYKYLISFGGIFSSTTGTAMDGPLLLLLLFTLPVLLLPDRDDTFHLNILVLPGRLIQKTF